MKGRPLRDAKRAAAGFLVRERAAGRAGLVSFGHEALALTQPREATSSAAAKLSSLAPDLQKGTALYDAVVLSAARLQQMSTGTRVLVLLTDGNDLGSKSTQSEAIAAARRADVTVYAIAAGATNRHQGPGSTRRRDRRPRLRRRRHGTPRRHVPVARPRTATHVAALVPLDGQAGRPAHAGGARGGCHGDDAGADSRERTMPVSSRAPSRATRSRPRSSSRWPRCCSPAQQPPDAVVGARPSSAACSSRTSRSATSPSGTSSHGQG